MPREACLKPAFRKERVFIPACVLRCLCFLSTFPGNAHRVLEFGIRILGGLFLDEEFSAWKHEVQRHYKDS